METMRLRAIQLPGNAGALLDSFIRAAGRLPCGAIEECGTWVRANKDEWQQCNE